MNTLPRHTRITLALLVLMPAYFLVAALGTRFGIWGSHFGLLTMTLGGGMILTGLAATVALISLVLAWRAVPRRNLAVAAAIIGLAVPLAALAMVLVSRGKVAENPIHDIATDTANPPEFSPATMALREAAGANPLDDYRVPLGKIALYQEAGIAPEFAVKNHAQIITDRRDRPAPLPLGGASRAEGVAAVAAAMGQMGLVDIRPDPAAGIVEGVAESTWFGIKDDVVARVGEAQIDFRSVSRDGASDLGANTARIIALRKRTQALLGTASR